MLDMILMISKLINSCLLLVLKCLEAMYCLKTEGIQIRFEICHYAFY